MSRLAIRTFCSLTCLALLLIAGCINYDQQLELNANGSGKLVMHYSMAQQLVSMMQMGGQAGGGEKDQQMPFKIKEDEVKADLQSPGVKFEKFESKTEGDQQHFYVHISFDKVTSLNNTKTFKEMPITWKEENGTVTFSQVLKSKKKEGASAGGDDAMQKQMAQAMFGNAAFKFAVKLPSKALPSPATNGTIAEDGKTVNWTFPLVELDSGDKVMTASFKTGLGIKTLAIVLGAGFLVLLGLIGIIMMMRKK
jgi:hypothetical protein